MPIIIIFISVIKDNCVEFVHIIETMAFTQVIAFIEIDTHNSIMCVAVKGN